MSTQTRTLPNRLKGFVDADSSSQAEGFLLRGRYVVLEVRENHPTDGTDYARVRARHLGNRRAARPHLETPAAPAL